MATGYGGHLAVPLIRERWRSDLTEEEARQLMEDCMRVLFYRDCRASNKVRQPAQAQLLWVWQDVLECCAACTQIQLAKVTSDGVTVSEPYCLDTKWDFAGFVKPKAGADTGGAW